jgi:hypothetical protein
LKVFKAQFRGIPGLAIPLLIAIFVLPAAASESVPPIPRDASGLPLWEIAVWDDFPVRLELSGQDELDDLLLSIPLASFSREQIAFRMDASGNRILVFEPRVTDAEAAALRGAGYEFTRLPDLDKEGRRAMEAAWAGAGLKTADELKHAADGYYPTHAQIGSILAQAEFDHSDICRSFTWGQSVLGRELWGLVVSNDPQDTSAEPEVRLSSSMHGNETVGLVMLMNFAAYLTDNYGVPGFEDVTYLVDNYEIHLLPLHNPDGYVAGVRVNDNGVDLNRNFTDPAGTHPVTELENINFMNYGTAHHFVISENFHGGALVVNYPWDYTYALNPDDAALIPLSLEYSTHNQPMFFGRWPQGITNGAAWYITTGCLQDWSYDATGCIDVTIEVSDSKTPPANELDGFWEDNRESLMHFVKAARYGINGVVTDAGSGAPLEATVTVAGNVKAVTTDPAHGDYYKLLPTGSFNLTFEADGYVTKTMSGVATTWGTPTVLDVSLESETSDVPTSASVRLRLAAAPNPFNPRTKFTITNPKGTRVVLDVHDLGGRRVRRLLAGDVVTGTAVVEWDGLDDQGREVPSGSYFARLVGGDEEARLKVVLIK